MFGLSFLWNDLLLAEHCLLPPLPGRRSVAVMMQRAFFEICEQEGCLGGGTTRALALAHHRPAREPMQLKDVMMNSGKNGKVIQLRVWRMLPTASVAAVHDVGLWCLCSCGLQRRRTMQLKLQNKLRRREVAEVTFDRFMTDLR